MNVEVYNDDNDEDGWMVRWILSNMEYALYSKKQKKEKKINGTTVENNEWI